MLFDQIMPNKKEDLAPPYPFRSHLALLGQLLTISGCDLLLRRSLAQRLLRLFMPGDDFQSCKSGL